MKLMLMGLFLMLPGLALAHPVAFQGSTGIMGYHSAGMMDMEVNHSVRYWFAPALQALRFSEGTQKPDYALGKLNFLAYRLNKRNYQANLYLHGGGGYSLLRKNGVFHGGITADIEDRKRYFLAQWDLIRSSRQTEAVFWKVRAGFAPYLGDFKDIHTWFILEANRKSVGERRVQIVPTLRFFVQNVLWEVGSSLGGEIHLNYIIHL
jgi:hypothetical protein